MRKFYAIAFLLLVACSTQHNSDKAGLEVRPKFIGTWKGSDNGQQIKNTKIHWVVHRFANGKYATDFTVVNQVGEADTHTEKGTWWLKDGNLYQLYSDSKVPDIYSYTFIDDEHVKLKVISSEVDHDSPEYEVIDTKIPPK